eukprot:TRINITY_DN1227_c0_g2_i1.p1 TRINITY_DN1227_c0_g2~~TRINITY_DN1227_c0_g2_i1.p1  ORF type:complete len:372 (-),score=45.44 TRINITY_DN1227_c0_g2_i1:107-1222(-)
MTWLGLLLFAIKITYVLSVPRDCTKFKCPDHPLTMQNDGSFTCSQENEAGNEVYVMPCQDPHMECIMATGITNSICNPRFENKYLQPVPGELCFSNDQCNSHYCLDNVCKGASIGEACDKNIECDLGLTCFPNGICGPPQEEGQICHDDLRCVSYLSCVNGTCIRYGSLSTGTIFYTSDSWGDSNLTCASGYAVSLSTNVRSPNPYMCKTGRELLEGTECTYYYPYEKMNKTESPVCGLSYTGEPFCGTGNLNADFKSNFTWLIKYLNEVKPRCNTAYENMGKIGLAEYDSMRLVNKFFCKNYASLLDFDRMKWNFMASLFFNNSVRFQNIDSCVEDLIAKSVGIKIEAKKAYAHRFSASILTILLIIFLL